MELRFKLICTVLLACNLCNTAMAQNPQSTQTEAVFVYAAGSLRTPLTQLARDFEVAHPGLKLTLVFGASGLLKDRIASQTIVDLQPAHVFASANMDHPQALAAGGQYSSVRRFTRNALCALTALPTDGPRGVREDNLVARLLDREVKVGISTPLADPSGDYTWQMFDRIEATGAGRSGAAAALKAKALQLTGGPNSLPPPADRNVYGMLASSGQADIFITYCTNAIIAHAEVPTLRVVSVPVAINVMADYGLTVARRAPNSAQAFADYVLSPGGQLVLARAGFTPVP